MNVLASRLGVLTLCAATVVALSGLVISGPAHAEPANGTCKVRAQSATANSAAAAQEAWSNAVEDTHGEKWALWVGAKAKTVTQINGGTMWRARAKPCFYQPVL